MIVNYSRKNLISLQTLCGFSAFLGVIPLYSFAQRRYLFKKTFRFYLILIFGGMLALDALTAYRISTHPEITLMTVMDALGEILGSLIWYTAVYQTFFKQLVWEKLFLSIIELEETNNLNSQPTKERSIWKNCNFQITIMIVMIVCTYIYEWCSLDDKSIKVFLTYTGSLYFFLHFLLSAIIANMALIVKNKFMILNAMLTNCESSDTLAMVKAVQKIKELYCSMTIVVQLFNELFGSQLFLMGLHCSSLIIQWSVALVYSMFEEKDDQTSQRLVVAVIYIALVLLWLGITMFCCDKAVVESEKMITICYKLQLNYPVFSEPYQSFKNLLYVVNNAKIIFTAMGYYEINRSTMFDLIGTTATYFVVLIQFHDGKKEVSN